MGAYLLPRLGTMQSGELVAELLTQRDELQDFIADLIAERLNEKPHDGERPCNFRWRVLKLSGAYQTMIEATRLRVEKKDDQKTLDVASRFTTKNREKKTVTKEITTKIEVEIDEYDLLAYLDTMAGVLDKMRFIKRAVESLTDHDIEKMADFLADQSADAESVRIFNLLNDLRAKLLELKCPKQQ